MSSLPAPLLAGMQSSYSDGGADITISQVIGPAQIRVLRQHHEVTEDPRDHVWRVLGSATHAIVEKSAESLTDWLIEQRYFVTLGGWEVGGQIDWHDLNAHHLYDLKVTSAWSVLGGTPKPEWVHQTNCYAHLLRANGVPVERISVVCLLRDWTKNKAKDSPDYPRHQVVVLDVPCWPDERAQQYLAERVRLHQQAEQAWARKEPLPRCTDEERWTRPGKVAAMKRGRKRAVKLFDTQPDCEAWIRQQDDAREFTIELRPASYPRCQDYCDVSEFCQQWKGGA